MKRSTIITPLIKRLPKNLSYDQFKVEYQKSIGTLISKEEFYKDKYSAYQYINT